MPEATKRPLSAEDAVPLDYTDNGDGTATLNNDPAPTEITIDRVPWQNMVTGVYPWATVTEEPSDPQDPNSQPVQILAIEATNVTASFRWLGTLPGRITYMSVTSWESV
jgi:hypothetical protein